MSHVEASLSGFTSPLCAPRCLQQQTQDPAETEMASGTGGFLLEPQHNVMQMGGDFANNPAAEQFIDKMVSKHGFDRQQLQEILSQASAWITSCA
jgi:membrane-bound lytic murein transglycosylase B